MPDRGRSLTPSRRPRYALLTGLTIVASFGVYLAGNGSVPLWDRDEPRYAQCTREMLRGSPEHPGPDFVVPRFLGETRYAKPPLIYWCQAAAMKLLGENAFAARFPSAVAMPVTLSVLALALWRRVGAARTFWTVFILATSVMVFVSAKACLTDSVLLLFVTISQLCLYAMWNGRGNWAVVVVMAVAVGLAGLTKGPVVLGVLLTTDIALAFLTWTLRRKRVRLPRRTARTSPFTFPLVVRAKVLVALLLVGCVVGPWLYLIQKYEPDFLATSIGHDVVNRVRSGLEGHKGPPGYHLVTVWGTFMPWSLLLPLAVVLGWRRRRLPAVRFALAAVVGPWLMFEAVQTKLPHYMLPCFPPLAFLAADAVVQCLRGRDAALVSPQFVNAATVWGVILALLGLAPWLAAWWFRPQPWAALVALSLVAVAVAVVAVTLFRRRRPAAALGATGVGMMAAILLAHLIYLPRAEFLKLSVRTAEVLSENGATGPGQAVMLDYKEPSLAFYQGGTIREHRATVLTDPVLAGAPQWLVITKEVWDRSPPDARARVQVVARFRGLDIAAGMRVVEVMVVREKGEREARSR